MNMFKVLIIGSKGRVAQRHIKAWDKLGISWDGVDIGDDFNINNYNLVDIATPIFLHAKMIQEYAKYGIPILCEKPLARTVEEAKPLLKLKGKIGIIHQFRFNPKVIKLKKEIDAGKYGDIKMVVSTYYRYRGQDYYKDWEGVKALAGGGTVLNVTIHYLDLMQWFFGYPTQIKGFVNTAKDIEVEDSAVAVMKFPNGTIGAYVATNHALPQKNYEFTIIGTKGSKTIQLRQNEYHAENFKAFLEDGEYMRPEEAMKSLKMAQAIINED